MDRPKIDYTPLAVYVPADASPWGPRPGCGIVGKTPPPQPRLLLYYEDYTEYANVVTYADLLHIAWGRCSQDAPTHKKVAIPSAEVTQVGIYDPRNGDLIVDPDERERVMRWLGIDPEAPDADAALERECMATQANHAQRRQIREALATGSYPRDYIARYARKHGHQDLLGEDGA